MWMKGIQAMVITDIVKDIITTRKRPKPKENQLVILKIYAFWQKIQQRASGPGESFAGVTYLSMRTHPKSCHIFPLKVETTLLSGSFGKERYVNQINDIRE